MIDIKFTPVYPSQGGQHVGTSTGTKAVAEEYGLEVIVHTHRSQYKNKIIAQKMIEYGISQLFGDNNG